MGKKGIGKTICKRGGLVMALLLILLPCLDSRALIIYESDGVSYEEGYIFIGESHINIACTHIWDATNETGIVPGVEDVHYHLDWTYGEGDDPMYPNKYTMEGNLFFVFGGMPDSDEDEAEVQTSKEYIYSDGEGNYGVGVAKIHEIIEKNPNIAHWNIISCQGAVQAVRVKDRSIPDYYVASYRNWIDYEFPEADVYFLSISTMTKFYKPAKKPDLLNQVLKEAFPDRFLDYTEFYNERYPQGMWDPQQKSDSLHWSAETYVELITSVIWTIQERREQPTVTHIFKVPRWRGFQFAVLMAQYAPAIPLMTR